MLEPGEGDKENRPPPAQSPPRFNRQTSIAPYASKANPSDTEGWQSRSQVFETTQLRTPPPKAAQTKRESPWQSRRADNKRSFSGKVRVGRSESCKGTSRRFLRSKRFLSVPTSPSLPRRSPRPPLVASPRLRTPPARPRTLAAPTRSPPTPATPTAQKATSTLWSPEAASEAGVRRTTSPWPWRT